MRNVQLPSRISTYPSPLCRSRFHLQNVAHSPKILHGSRCHGHFARKRYFPESSRSVMDGGLPEAVQLHREPVLFASGLRDNSLLPPCGLFRLCLEPVIQIVSVFFSALFEKFVCTEPDCLSQFRPNLVLRRYFSRVGWLSASIHGVFLHTARESCIRHYPSSRRA